MKKTVGWRRDDDDDTTRHDNTETPEPGQPPLLFALRDEIPREDIPSLRYFSKRNKEKSGYIAKIKQNETKVGKQLTLNPKP